MIIVNEYKDITTSLCVYGGVCYRKEMYENNEI
jgi:hypothetical protein